MAREKLRTRTARITIDEFPAIEQSPLGRALLEVVKDLMAHQEKAGETLTEANIGLMTYDKNRRHRNWRFIVTATDIRESDQT